jgi:hypothetical protein
MQSKVTQKGEKLLFFWGGGDKVTMKSLHTHLHFLLRSLGQFIALVQKPTHCSITQRGCTTLRYFKPVV